MTTASDITDSDDAELVRRVMRQDPSWFFSNVLGCESLWPHQIAIANSVRDHRHTAVRTHNGAGKDFVAAQIALWFAYAHDNATVVITSATYRQVVGITFREIAKAYNRSLIKLDGSLLTDQLKIDDSRLIVGFTADDNDEGAFHGWHADHLLVIMDEAGALSDHTYVAAKACAIGEGSKMLSIGNPTDPQSAFAKLFTNPEVAKIGLSCFDSPNFTEYGLTLEDIADNSWIEKINGPLPAPYLITPQFVRDAYIDWGPDSPMFKARCLGEFPSETVDSLVQYGWIAAAIGNGKWTSVSDEPITLSVDVARDGDDFTTIYSRQGNYIRKVMSYRHVDTMETCGRVMRLLSGDAKIKKVIVDATGVGGPVVDRLRELHAPVHEFIAASRARAPEMFANARAESYFALRKAFERGEIAIDNNSELINQLTSIKWKVQSSGKIIIESKDDIKKRIGRSCDDSDAVAQLFAATQAAPVYFAATEKVAANRVIPYRDRPKVDIGAY